MYHLTVICTLVRSACDIAQSTFESLMSAVDQICRLLATAFAYLLVHPARFFPNSADNVETAGHAHEGMRSRCDGPGTFCVSSGALSWSLLLTPSFVVPAVRPCNYTSMQRKQGYMESTPMHLMSLWQSIHSTDIVCDCCDLTPPLPPNFCLCMLLTRARPLLRARRWT